MLDQDNSYDGDSFRNKPLGGTESSFVSLAEAFSNLGHNVTALTRIDKVKIIEGVNWKPLDFNFKDCDLFIANRAPELLSKAPVGSKKLLWLHNPGNYLNKLRNFKSLLLKNIVVVCCGDYHLSTVPFWLRSRTIKIPLGLPSQLLEFKTDKNIVPDPISIFSSNPERGLIWLAKLWNDEIAVNVPGAKLCLFAGHETYGGRKKDKISNILDSIRELNSSCIEVNKPVTKNELFKKLILSRVMLYQGDEGETFCLAVAEAQALGVPAVVKSIGSLPERVKHNVTGFVVNNDEDFVKAAISVLTDDKLWEEMKNNSLKMQRNNSWNKVAKKFISSTV